MISDIRRYALSMSLESSPAHSTTADIVVRASEFEKYMTSGYTPEEPKRAQDA